VSGPGKGDKRGYSWPPVEPGQAGAAHPSTTHGAWSPVLRDPVAAAIYEQTMTWVPEQLRDEPLIVAETREYAQVAAMAAMIYEHMTREGLAAALDDVTVTEAVETELHTEGRTARKARSQARRTVALAEQYRRYAAQASRMREGLRKAVIEQGADKPFDLALAIAALDDEEESSGR
jgi:hypothetical protein